MLGFRVNGQKVISREEQLAALEEHSLGCVYIEKDGLGCVTRMEPDIKLEGLTKGIWVKDIEVVNNG